MQSCSLHCNELALVSQPCLPIELLVCQDCLVAAFMLNRVWKSRGSISMVLTNKSCFYVQGVGVVNDLPTLGTALPISVTAPAQLEGPSKGPLALPAVGSWVKLRNVKAWVIAGQLQVGILPHGPAAEMDTSLQHLEPQSLALAHNLSEMGFYA